VGQLTAGRSSGKERCASRKSRRSPRVYRPNCRGATLRPSPLHRAGRGLFFAAKRTPPWTQGREGAAAGLAGPKGAGGPLNQRGYGCACSSIRFRWSYRSQLAAPSLPRSSRRPAAGAIAFPQKINVTETHVVTVLPRHTLSSSPSGLSKTILCRDRGAVEPLATGLPRLGALSVHGLKAASSPSSPTPHETSPSPLRASRRARSSHPVSRV
jgi:hypothetical protein